MLPFDAVSHKFKPSRENIPHRRLRLLAGCLLCAVKHATGVTCSTLVAPAHDSCARWPCVSAVCALSSHTCLFTLLPAARTGSPAGDSADRGTDRASADRTEGEATPVRGSVAPRATGVTAAPQGCGAQLLLQQAGITVLGNTISSLAPSILGATAAPSGY